MIDIQSHGALRGDLHWKSLPWERPTRISGGAARGESKDIHTLDHNHRSIELGGSRGQRPDLGHPEFCMLHVQVGVLAVREALLGVALAAVGVLLLDGTTAEHRVRSCAV